MTGDGSEGGRGEQTDRRTDRGIVGWRDRRVEA